MGEKIISEKFLKVKKDFFGYTDNQEIFLFSFENINGMKVKICNYGGIVQSLFVPDKNRNSLNITPGFSSLEEYITSNVAYFGAIIGRYANRIADGRFLIDNSEYILPVNSPPNCLHGGGNGFHTKVWDFSILENGKISGIELMRKSPDGEEGFPGNLDIRVQYLITENNELVIYTMPRQTKKQLSTLQTTLILTCRGLEIYLVVIFK